MRFRYATNRETASVLKEIARQKGLPLQEFVVRNDTGCGSTVGPILAANTGRMQPFRRLRPSETIIGMRTIDIGIPQLSMHSIREICGVDDVEHGVRLLKAFFEEYPAIDAAMNS
jgi:aspartyl aminopeptidase